MSVTVDGSAERDTCKALAVAACSLLAVIALACNDKEPAAATQAAPAKAAASAQPQAAPAASGATEVVDCSKLELLDSVDEEAFHLELKKQDSYAAGQPGSVEVKLQAKAGYHANEEYPYKFKVQSCPGLEYEQDVVRGEAVKIEGARAELQVPFRAKGSGESLFAGTFAFSVCSAERCLVEKRDLALKLQIQ